MTPGIALPDPIPLPAPAWLLWALLMLTFTLHVLAMNLTVGGAAIGLVARLQSRRGPELHQTRLARFIGRALPVLIAATVTLGVAALLFLQVLYGRVFFASSIVMAWAWLAVVPLLIVGYYAAYGVVMRSGYGGALLPLVTLAAVACIGLIYTTNMTLMLRPQAIAAAYALDGRGLQFRFQEPSLWPRYLHMITAAIAMASVAIAALGAAQLRSDESHGRWAMTYGAVWFASATVVNMVVGLWWLGTLPTATLLALLGQNAGATIMFVLGIAAGLVAMVSVIAAAQSPRPVPLLCAGVACLLVTIVAMIFTRDFVRRVSLELAGFQPVEWTMPQWAPIAIFGILLVAAIALVAWMARALMAAPASAPASHARVA